MKKCTAVLAATAVVGMFLVSVPNQAEARPQYLKSFVDKYDIAAAKELKCGVCHGEAGKNKKVVSDYGKALAEAIGEKNSKNAIRIVGSFEKIEPMKPNGVDKTFGELLKAGELPPAAE